MDQTPIRPGMRPSQITTAAIALFLCFGGLVLFGDWPKNGIRVKRLEADLIEQLPYGSTWEQAEAWFASHGIKAGDVFDKNGKVGLFATVSNDSLLESAEIRIELHFSPDGRLTERLIYRFVLSL